MCRRSDESIAREAAGAKTDPDTGKPFTGERISPNGAYQELLRRGFLPYDAAEMVTHKGDTRH